MRPVMRLDVLTLSWLAIIGSCGCKLTFETADESFGTFEWDSVFGQPKRTRVVNVVQGRRDRFYAEIVKYFMEHKGIALNLSAVKHNRSFSEVDLNPQGPARRWIVLSYGSREELKSSLFVDKWSLFEQLRSSFFVFALPEEVRCESKASLKQSIGSIFEECWRVYEIANVLVVLPRFCSSVLVLKFDPFCAATMDCECLHEVTSKDGKLIEDQDNLHKYPLRVSVFDRSPTMLKQMPSSILNTYLRGDTASVDSISGVDGFVLGNMADRLNVSLTITEPEDGEDYGSVGSDGSVSGSLGDVVYKRVDISMNARFIQDYGTEDVEYTYPIYNDQLCLIVPKAGRISYALSIFQVFRPSTWGLFLGTVFVLSGMWCYFRNGLLNNGEGFMDFMDIFLLIVSRPMREPVTNSERIFIISCLLLNLVFVGSFQGYMITDYSAVPYYKDIDTLKGVEKTKLPIAASPSIGEVFTPGVNSVMDRLSRRIQIGFKPKSLSHDEGPSVIIAERKSDARIKIELKHTNNIGEPLLHIVDECPKFYQLAYIVRKDFPFLEHVNRFLLKASSAGLIDKWYNFTEYALMLHIRMNRDTENIQYEAVNLDDLQTPVYLVCFGWFVSSTVFVLELLVHRRKTQCPNVVFKCLKLK